MYIATSPNFEMIAKGNKPMQATDADFPRRLQVLEVASLSESSSKWLQVTKDLSRSLGVVQSLIGSSYRSSQWWLAKQYSVIATQTDTLLKSEQVCGTSLLCTVVSPALEEWGKHPSGIPTPSFLFWLVVVSKLRLAFAYLHFLSWNGADCFESNHSCITSSLMQ